MHKPMHNKSFFTGLFAATALLFVAAFALLFWLPTHAHVQAEAQSSLTLRIPAIDVEASIVSVPLRVFADGSITWDVSTLTSEVGYMEGTAWFNEAGNTGLSAHSELENREAGVFYDLDKLQPGDHIYVEQDNQSWHYIVTDVLFVSSNDVSVVYPSLNERLTLLTCDTDSYSDGVYSGRVVVVAERAA